MLEKVQVSESRGEEASFLGRDGERHPGGADT